MGKMFKFMRCVARIVFPRRKVVYVDGAIEPTEPSIFVCNHSGAMGPCLMEMDFNLPKRIWLTSIMLDKQNAPNYIYHDFMFGRSKKNKKLWRRRSKSMAKLLDSTLNGYQGLILVHKGGMKIKDTFKQSIDAMREGYNVVIFPECHERNTEHINKLNKGFVELARFASKGGNAVKLYPAYIGKGLRTINVGKPTTYNSENEKHVEAERICHYLEENIEQIATSLPKHKVVPYVADAFYDSYGEYEKDEVGYYNLVNQHYSE